MKRKITSLLGALLGAMMLTAPAMAADSISNTGPGSTNFVTHSSSTTLTCTNNNIANVLNANAQASNSGSAAVTGNTTAGSATSGSSSNSNTTATAIAQQNSCLPAAQQAVANPTPDGGKGGDMPAEASTQVAALPNTGPVSPVEATARVSALLSGLAIAAYLGRGLVLRNQS